MTDIADRTIHSESATASSLPLRGNVSLEQRSVAPKPKNINDTVGGKIINFITFYGVGFVGNSSLSLIFTYLLNPRKWVSDGKASITEAITGLFKSADPVKTHDSVRSTIEILFMFIAGFVATGIMTPLVKNRGKIAYKINQLLGKDTDVLPENMIPVPAPRTVEEKIEQEINKRVNKKHSGTDLWKSRFASMGIVMAGDYVVNRSSQMLEASGKPSVDTLSWRLGQKLYEFLPKKSVAKVNEFFSHHGASIKDIENNMKDHFQRLEKTEIKYGSLGGPAINDRMVISEQTRLVAKEVGWTLILATFVHKLTGWFHNRRVKNEQQEAIAEITKEGLVPEGYKVIIQEGVKLERIGPPEDKPSQWTQKTTSAKPRPEKSEAFTSAVDKSRSGLTGQPAL